MVMGLALMTLALAAGAPVHASPQAPATQAQVQFDLGRRLYAVSEYRKALDAFKAAYVAKADPALLFNIAECHRQLGERTEAITFYRRFLTRDGSGPLRAVAEQRIAELEAAPPSPVPLSPVQTSPVSAEAPVLQESPSDGAKPQHPGPAPSPQLVASPAQPKPDEAPPVYRRWWFWAVGAGVLAGAVGTLALVGRDASRSDCLGITPCGTLP